ncbi:DUF6083 domain-containing protein [Streptomyces tauricus]|uniref:DUF6083 domain-containing protein n=1 Tax=Streptomyces tauricus TaxID=68274 RepID=UPI00339EB700
MRSTPFSAARHQDGRSSSSRTRRSLQVAPDGISRLLRCGQGDRCHECGNRIEFYPRGTGPQRRPVRLHPHELPTARVPATCRWHVSSGAAYPAEDGSRWCRLPHAAVCPARDMPLVPDGLIGLRRSLAVNTRRLIDAGVFAPPSTSPQSPTPQKDVQACRPARPIVRLLYVHYLAARPVDDIQCVAQTRRRQRCTNTLLSSGAPPGTWTLLPATAQSGQLAPSAAVMAVYDLAGVPYAEQLRWRAQRCPQHAAIPTAADLAVADWESFDPLRHHEHIHTRLPTRTRRSGPSRAQAAVRP